MDEFSAVVYTAGRTGSHLIIGNLCRHFLVGPVDDQEFNVKQGIVHTHNPLYKPPAENFIAIVSHRRSLFDAVLSTEITKKPTSFRVIPIKELRRLL